MLGLRRLPGAPALRWGIFLAGVALALCVVPLFNLLGYESSLVLALCATCAAANLSIHAVFRLREGISPAGRDLCDARPLSTVLGFFIRGAGSVVLLLVGPLIILLANGLRVKNCDYLAGLAFFLIMPVASSACGAACGTVAALLARHRRRALLLACAMVLTSLLWALLRFLSSPAIYAYDPFFGYFPGALYDEDVTIHASFLAARALHAAGCALALLLCALFLDGHALRLRARLRALRGGLMGASLMAGALFAALFHLRGDLGIHRDARAIEEELAGERRTEHFVLRYRKGGAVARDIDLYARDHELRHAQLARLLGVTPEWRPTLLQRLLGMDNRHGRGRPLIVSYLFESARDRQRLMGASATSIAKPWRREIYLQHQAFPHPVLKHELAHIFLGAAGDPLLRLSMRGLLPHQGLIEGAAVAADWPAGRLTPHQAVKAMRDARIEPPLERVLGLAFVTQASGRAYTVAGSFCRYLLDRHGPAPLLRVYREGATPESFARAYGAPFPELARAWSRFIDGQEVAPEDREVERERLRRPAVFHKVCAHELALRRRAAQEAEARGDAELAERLLESVCEDDPAEPRHLSELMDLLWAHGHRQAAVRAAERLLAHPADVPVLRAQAIMLLGDAAWLRGEAGVADRRFAEALRKPASEGMTRLLLARRQALREGRAGVLMLRALIGEPGEGEERAADKRNAALDLVLLGDATREAPGSGLAHYLYARQLFNRGGFAEAAEAFARALALPLPDARFVLEARRLHGQALLRKGEARAAVRVFEALLTELDAPQHAGLRVELEDWIERARGERY